MQVASAFFYPAFMHRTSNRGFMYVGNPAVHPQSIDTYEMLLGWASPAIRGEVNAYVNRVRDFITFDRVRRAQSGKLQFSNQGDLSVAGLELQAVFLPATWLRLNANGAVTHPIDSQTDPMFLVQGGLGGASVFPRLLTTLRAAVDLWEGVWLSLGACYSSRVDFEIVPEVRFTGLVGTDGGIYDSRPAESYDTGELSFDIALSIELPAGFRMVASASNVTNDKSYMPGATLLPYLRQGRVVEIVIMHELSTDAGE